MKKVRIIFFSCFLNISLRAIIPSLVSASMCFLFPTLGIAQKIQLAINLISLIWIAFFLFDFRMVQGKKSRYYYYNLSAFGLYSAIGLGSIVMFYLLKLSEDSIVYKIHSFMFFNYKLFHYFSYSNSLGFKISNFYSAIYCTLIYLALILIVPLFVRKRKILSKVNY